MEQLNRLRVHSFTQTLTPRNCWHNPSPTQMAAERLGAHTTVTTVDSAITDFIHYAAPSPVASSILAWVFDAPLSFSDAVYNSTLSACVMNGASVAFQFNGEIHNQSCLITY